MKKFILFGLFAAFVGFAFADDIADRQTATSLTYVNDELSTRQDKIEAQSGTKVATFTDTAGEIAPREVKSDLGNNTNDTALPTVSAVNDGLGPKQDTLGANKHADYVATYTNTPGTLGEKGIYQDTGTYNNQGNSLVDAGTFNAALQNGLDNEFVCADRPDAYDPVTGNCWLWEIHNETENHSKNLLDPSFMDNSTYGTVTINGVTTQRAKVLPTENGKTYTLSATLTSTGRYYYYLTEILPDGTVISADNVSQCRQMWNNNSASNVNTTVRKKCTFNARNNATYVVYFATGNSPSNLILTNYQMEEGSVQTPYVPYGNIYLPENQPAQN